MKPPICSGSKIEKVVLNLIKIFKAFPIIKRGKTACFNISNITELELILRNCPDTWSSLQQKEDVTASHGEDHADSGISVLQNVVN